MRNLVKTAVIAAITVIAAMAQSVPAAPATTPISKLALPAYVMGGVSFNQLSGLAGFVSGIVPESQSVGLYGSATTDLVPLKTSVNGKNVFLLSGSARAGQHKVLYNGPKNMLLAGGDIGAAFNSATGSSSPGLTIGVAGSFTLTYIFKASEHWAIAAPLRMLWMSNVGPNGTGAWNPVGELGLVWKP